jgi:GNAT superfamily N-acetyltransferase
VIQQLVQHGQRTGARPLEAMKMLSSGALAIARIKALAVVEDLRGYGIGSALLHRSWQIFDHSGYLILRSA